jgi:endonuclease III
MVKMLFKQEKMQRIFPEETWNDLHLQIIWYGENIRQRERVGI